MSDDEPKFDFSEGAGETLGSLPCFTTVSARGAAGKALESALEPLHRLVYGRPGMSGRRRAALEDFKGFPPSMRAEVEEKTGKLTKDRLRDIIKALGIAVHISQTQAEVAAGVVAYLMAPKDEGRIKDTKTAPTKKRSASPNKAAPEAKKRPAESSVLPSTATEGSKPKRPKTESSAVSVSSAATSDGPSDDAVLVQVYRLVLAMPYEERAVLGVKALRTKLEEHFKLPPGGLKSKKDIITSTASDCVRALREAEDRAAAVLQSAGDATRASTGAKAPADPSPAVATVAAAGKVEEEDTSADRATAAAKPTAASESGAQTSAAPAPIEPVPAVSHVVPMHPGVVPV
ncbi:hypothetical protein ABL78_8196 [Leptomonas seymouri]|uniref:DEK C-terminal domain-containing protein n=1 Tax=Leptomonas seymouri TaxID=5684 RepID=A0A0N0P2C3_LEPSE|nr:hypothetical protein ABL78_8196 [Leptomonas seymouri]|eukprot:KPI82789.1 hypothetical protein ABL78_8196 [Leptomonas seymouri]